MSIIRTNTIRQLLLNILIAAWIFSLIHLFGNTADTGAFGRSAFAWMINRWQDSTLYAGDYSHGWLIPIVSVFALWQARERLRTARQNTCWLFLPLICLAFLLLIAASRAQLPRLALFSLLLLIWSIPAFLRGKETARIMAFPAFYLFFCIPLNFLDSIAFPLRMIATNISTFLLNGLGIPALAKGTAILSPTGAFSLEVADPCSGIKSLLALTAITVAYAHFFQNKIWQKAILVIMSGGLAVAGNVARIATLAVFATWFGQEKAFEFYHDYSGYVVFIVAVLLMLAIDKGLQTIDSKLSPTPSNTGNTSTPA